MLKISTTCFSLLFLAGGLSLRADTPETNAPPLDPATGLIQSSDNLHAPYMSVYKGSVNGAANPYGIKRIEAYAAWLNRTLVWGEDTLPNSSWDNVEGGGWQFDPWGSWVEENPNRRVIFSVPIIPGPWNNSGPKIGINANQPLSLEEGATGAYNEHYRKLAENLVKHHLGNSILRLGWEFTGGWYAWRVQGVSKAEAFAGYWKQIVTTMRSVPGTEKLQFDWNPALGWTSYNLEKAWPGDDYVDFVGPDIYDDCYAKDTYPWPKDASADVIAARRKKAWEEVDLGSSYGLRYWVQFSQKHKKPLTFPEWGIDNKPDHHGGGDEPAFIENMYRFIYDPANNIYFHSYFDYQAGDGHHQLAPQVDGTVITEFPKSAETFHRLFSLPGKGSPSP